MGTNTFSRTSINHVRKLIQLSKLCKRFNVPCPLQPETVLARTFCKNLHQHLNLGEATREVDYEHHELFPPKFREVAYWEAVLRCTGHYPNVLSGITMLRFHAQSQSNKEMNLNEITITLPLLPAMRLCAAGESTAQSNKRSLIQGSCVFLPPSQDCEVIQRPAATLLATIQRYPEARGLDLSLIRNLVKEGLFNTHSNPESHRTNPQASGGDNFRAQGVSVYVTGLPLNLHSGIQPLDNDANVQFDGDTRHFLTDSHPLHINEPTMHWEVPLRELVWHPPVYWPWVGSWAFPTHT